MKVKNTNDKQKGITLIVLIITIIVMLILVATTISLTLNTGLFEKASEATNKWKVAQEEEKEASKGKVEIDGVEYNTIDEYLETLKENESQPVDASLINESPTTYYGKEVVNYGVIYDNTESAENKWRIFYADEDNIYLIADDYINHEYAPSKLNKEEGSNYKLYFETIMHDNDATTTIDSTFENEWLSAWAGQGKPGAIEGIRATAFMSNASIWNPIYKNDYAEYAIGGPTLEMFCASYKDTHPSEYLECDVDSDGYVVRLRGGVYVSPGFIISPGITVDVPIDEFNSIYFKSDTSKADDMWLSSHSSHINMYYASNRQIIGATYGYYKYNDSRYPSNSLLKAGNPTSEHERWKF